MKTNNWLCDKPKGYERSPAATAMKTTALILAGLLACNTVKAPEPEPKMTFAEGVCAGLFLGCFAGCCIYVVWRCAQNIHVPPPETNDPPVWVDPPPPPPPDTNNLPTNSVAKIPQIITGNAGAVYDLGTGTKGYLTTVEASDNLKDWHTLCHLQGYVGGSGQSWVAYSLDWHPIGSGSTLIPMTLTNKFYRTKLDSTH